MNANSLFIGVLAGVVGGAYLLYGRKTSKVTAMICGVGLMVYPYFVDNVWLLLVIGAPLCIAPFVVKE
jgi:hypothetical protein